MLALMSQAACTTIVIGEDAQHDIVSLGVTRVVVPERSGSLIAFKRSGVGFGYGAAVGDAAWLGFDNSEWVIADPAECQLLVIVRSEAEAENAERILENLKGEDICFVNET